MLVAQSCLTLCDPMDCSPQGSPVHGILQAIILEWVAVPFSKGSSWPRDGTGISCISRQILYHWATWEAPGPIVLYAKSFQSSPILCDPVDHSLPGSSVHGTLQARILEWVATPTKNFHFSLSLSLCIIFIWNVFQISIFKNAAQKH